MVDMINEVLTSVAFLVKCAAEVNLRITPRAEGAVGAAGHLLCFLTPIGLILPAHQVTLIKNRRCGEMGGRWEDRNIMCLRGHMYFKRGLSDGGVFP